MMINKEILQEISHEYGSSFYILDIRQFEKNYDELLSTFNDLYPNSHISYSYKTNYIPKLCKTILEKGGYAEVVSDMEYDIALKVGVPPKKVIFNGPWKKKEAVKEIVLNDGIVNLDSLYDFEIVKEIAKNTNKKIKIGIRVNFDINDGVVSRFGFDVQGEDFERVLSYIENEQNNLILEGIHSHFASRNINFWPNRATKMVELIEQHKLKINYFSLGGGIFGKMDPSLKEQFDSYIPTYEDYAKAVCPILFDYFSGKGELPKMFLEPGSALVGDCMQFACPVVSIKDIRGQKIATLLGSIYNINPTLNSKNPPIEVYHFDENKNVQYSFKNLNFGGFTCIESDYLYKNYTGELAVDDLVVFKNIGSYSIVLKPPFILPNFPVISIEDDIVKVIKRKETFDDIFQTYEFNYE